jgi:hypothetical protein
MNPTSQLLSDAALALENQSAEFEAEATTDTAAAADATALAASKAAHAAAMRLQAGYDRTLAASLRSDLDAFTPDQSALDIVTPGGSLIYSTFGLGHAAGAVHELEISQELTISEDDPSPDGKLLGAASHGYMRTLRLKLLATSTRPAPGTTLSLTGAPDHAADYKIESSDEVYGDKRGKMYEVLSVWIPPFSS